MLPLERGQLRLPGRPQVQEGDRILIGPRGLHHPDHSNRARVLFRHFASQGPYQPIF